MPAHRVAAEAPAPASAPVRSGDFGRGGRFEKFILALQALTLDAGAASSRTDRVERMRAAAEELFGIDGVPQPVPPMVGPAAAPAPADGATHVGRGEPEPAPGARMSEPERPPYAGTEATADAAASADPAAAKPPAAALADGAAGPLRGGSAAEG